MNRTTPNRAAAIIERFGGTSALQKALGHRWPSTVQGWKTRGVIPQEHIPAILAAAKARGIDLVLADFFPAPEQDEASQETADSHRTGTHG